jgi:hypothetical protein
VLEAWRKTSLAREIRIALAANRSATSSSESGALRAARRREKDLANEQQRPVASMVSISGIAAITASAPAQRDTHAANMRARRRNVAKQSRVN